MYQDRGRAGSPLRLVYLAVLFFCGWARAETTILECVADGRWEGGASMKAREIPASGTLLAQFRMWVIANWRIQGATLFLHIAKGRAPSMLEVAAVPVAWAENQGPSGTPDKLTFRSREVRAEPEGWISLPVDPEMVENMAQKRAFGLAIRVRNAGPLVFHSRETTAFSPYLIVAGGRL